MITREQIEEIQTESREKGVSIKNLLKEKGIPENQYFWWKRKYSKPDVPEGFLPVAGSGLVIYNKRLDHGCMHLVERVQDGDPSITPLEWNKLVGTIQGIIGDPRRRLQRLKALRDIQLEAASQCKKPAGSQ